MYGVNWLKSGLRAPFLRLEQVCEKFFGPSLNPLVHLGSLGWFLYWIIIVTGIYIYVFFDTGITQAYESLEYLPPCSGTSAESCAACIAMPRTV